MLSGIDDGQSCQGCQMHLKVSRSQAHCPLGRDTIDFRRAWFLFSGVGRRLPAKDLTRCRAHLDIMKDAGVVALVFVAIVRMVVSSLAASGFSFYTLFNLLLGGAMQHQGEGRTQVDSLGLTTGSNTC